MLKKPETNNETNSKLKEKKEKKEIIKEQKDLKLTYKGKPLLRFKDSIYYGDMKDDYVAILKIKSKKKFKDINIADKVSVQLLDTDPDVSIFERIVKKSEKKGLYQALDLASVWLTKALAN